MSIFETTTFWNEAHIPLNLPNVKIQKQPHRTGVSKNGVHIVLFQTISCSQGDVLWHIITSSFLDSSNRYLKYFGYYETSYDKYLQTKNFKILSATRNVLLHSV